jgi:hypothetical protein
MGLINNTISYLVSSFQLEFEAQERLQLFSLVQEHFYPGKVVFEV